MSRRHIPTLTHWGAYALAVDDDRITEVHPLLDDDPEPSPLGEALLETGTARVLRPSVRRSWLDGGPGAATDARGHEAFVEVSWDEALDLVAGEVERVRTERGNEAIYAGSYGWASAGRFHHAQSQLKRFLTLAGGFVASDGTYSHGAAEVVLPRIAGLQLKTFLHSLPPVTEIAEHTERFVSFGGLPVGNTQIVSGGTGRHEILGQLRRAADRGCRFTSLAPLRSEVDDRLQSEWLPLRPGSDTAVLLSMLHHLVATERIDLEAFGRHCSGTEVLLDHLAGRSDGVVRDPSWAAALSGLSSSRIASLAEECAESRTLLNLTWSVQRTDHGEHAVWAAIALGAALGQGHLPGAGVGFGYGSMGAVGAPLGWPAAPALPTGGTNPVSIRIPVARLADMLLDPGGTYPFDGTVRTYPDIAMVYWAGGNPFHHHQDLHRLERAWQQPDTIVVNEPYWTATARRADVVLPTTLPTERRDLGGGSSDAVLVAMEPAVAPPGEARDDHAIFTALAARLGFEERFTEGRSVDEWLRWMYDRFRAQEPTLPDAAMFRERGVVERRPDDRDRRRLVAFHTDPESAPLPTISGRIELTLPAGNGAELPAHPRWVAPAEWLGNAADDQLHLLSPQPRHQLHSQFDFSAPVQRHRREGRAVAQLHPADAAVRGIEQGGLVRLWNTRGSCLAAAEVTDRVMARTVVLPTGAWWDPDPDSGACRRGNPNVLTRDVGTSAWAQATSAHTCLVRVAPLDYAPAPTPHGAPPREERS
jgi:biotin/methionine sulfoxide reductase